MEKPGERLKEVYGGQQWILAFQAATATIATVESLQSWGSTTVVVASTEGTGDLPEAEIIYTNSRGDSALNSIREFYASVEDPQPEVLRAVDRLDPDRAARIITEPHATANRMLARPTFGVRKREWSAWEDKMRVDQLWEDLEIPIAPYRITSLEGAPAAANELAADLGTVWVADNSAGWHGGGELVRWVAGRGEHRDAVAWFSPRSRKVRVMPFLEGLPCSIHGWVTATGVAVFLPVEIFILRHAHDSGLEYAGVGTVWDAPADARDSMREVARRVGRHLGRASGYIGPFGVDGILTSGGFRPTELNPRMSAGALAQLRVVDVPMELLMRAEIESLVEVDHKWLEETALLQRKPVFRFGKMVSGEVRDILFVGSGSDGRLRSVGSEEGSLGTITAGPSSTGSYILGNFDVEKVAAGEPVGRLVADALNLANEKWDLGLPELAAAPYMVP